MPDSVVTDRTSVCELHVLFHKSSAWTDHQTKCWAFLRRFIYQGHQLTLTQNKWERTWAEISFIWCWNFLCPLEKFRPMADIYEWISSLRLKMEVEEEWAKHQGKLQTREMGKNHSTKPTSKNYVHFFQKAPLVRSHEICDHHVADLYDPSKFHISLHCPGFSLPFLITGIPRAVITRRNQNSYVVLQCIYHVCYTVNEERAIFCPSRPYFFIHHIID